MKRRRSSCVPLKWKNCRLPYEQRISTNRSAPHATKPCLHCPARKTATYRNFRWSFSEGLSARQATRPSHARLFGIGAARSKPSFRLARSGTNPATSRHDAANATGIRRLYGKSVKIVIPFTLRTGRFHAHPNRSNDSTRKPT